jgi:hypothetical protein
VSILGRPTFVSPHQSGPATDSPHQRRWKKEEPPHLHTDKNNKSKSLSDYTQQDLSVAAQGSRILEMQMLQNDTDSILLTVIIKHF